MEKSNFIGLFIMEILIAIVSIILCILLFIDNFKEKEYEVVKVVHYQACEAKEINQVWLENSKDERFCIYVNDEQYFELSKKNDKNKEIMILSEDDLKEIPNNK